MDYLQCQHAWHRAFQTQLVWAQEAHAVTADSAL